PPPGASQLDDLRVYPTRHAGRQTRRRAELPARRAAVRGSAAARRRTAAAAGSPRRGSPPLRRARYPAPPVVGSVRRTAPGERSVEGARPAPAAAPAEHAGGRGGGGGGGTRWLRAARLRQGVGRLR